MRQISVKNLENTSRKIEGLGDVIHTAAKVTGVAAAVRAIEKVTGGDCGCKKRRERLNKAFPFRKGNK